MGDGGIGDMMLLGGGLQERKIKQFCFCIFLKKISILYENIDCRNIFFKKSVLDSLLFFLIIF